MIKTLCDNHRGIKLIAAIILHRLTLARENYIREPQAGFRRGRGCIGHIFTLPPHLEQNILHRLTMVMFLDLQATFDVVD